MPPFEISGAVPGSSLVNGAGTLFGSGDGRFNEQPGWQARLRPAAYISPKGTRIEFAWESTRREISLRNVAFEFPGVDDAYVQQNGFGPRRYPLRCYFWGDNFDKTAAAFEAALLERGTGTLEHPTYGKIKVSPVGDVIRDDDPKSAGNQAVIEVAFWTTTSIVYPSSSGSPKNEIQAALDDFAAAAGAQFAGAADLRSTVAQANAKAKINKYLRYIEGTVGLVAKAKAEVNRPFRDAMRALNFGLDVLIGQPLQLALQLTNLITMPARALVGLESRVASYRALAARIIASPVANTSIVAPVPASGRLQGLRLREVNNLFISDHFVTSAAAGTVLAALETQYTTRREAIVAAEAVVDQLAELILWRDERYEVLDQTDTGESYQALQAAAALVAGYLVASPEATTAAPSGSSGSVTGSTRPLVERRYVLDRARTIIDVCAELYGTVDDKLDFLINTNNLAGSDILELPKGRELAYFV